MRSQLLRRGAAQLQSREVNASFFLRKSNVLEFFEHSSIVKHKKTYIKKPRRFLRAALAAFLSCPKVLLDDHQHVNGCRVGVFLEEFFYGTEGLPRQFLIVPLRQLITERKKPCKPSPVKLLRAA